MMPLHFQTILIPVDFTANTEAAVSKGLELAHHTERLHLLYVLQPPPFALSPVNEKEYLKASGALELWKEKIQHLKKNMVVHTSIVTAAGIQEAIIAKIIATDADLVVIGQRRAGRFTMRRRVLPSQIQKATGAAVLIVRPGALQQPLKTVVVPVLENISHQHLDALGKLCQSVRVKVHLATFTEEGTMPFDKAGALLRTYQWLQQSLHCPVEYTILHGQNRRRALMEYTHRIGADLLLAPRELQPRWRHQYSPTGPCLFTV